MSDDRIRSHRHSPADWGAAFAALPPEAPDADAWPRLARALARRRRARWPVWFAAAAVLAIAAVVPWRLSTHALQGDRAPSADRAISAAPAAPTRTGVRAAADTRVADASGNPDTRTTATASDRVPAGDSDTATAPLARSASGDNARRAPEDAAVMPAGVQRIASRDATAPGGAPATTGHPVSELERLYAESAQLEALVAMARDDRIASSGAAAALASQYEAQVIEIDVRLIQPGLTHEERTRLWRERVTALRRLAGFESTQRLLAARGERYDAMLVSID